MGFAWLERELCAIADARIGPEVIEKDTLGFDLYFVIDGELDVFVRSLATRSFRYTRIRR